ncbi:hypothetical protein AB1L30_21070 [Bremerella sp. JC817]|uniref:hypothetical protein n=1 Tax=Bremerella sp. JC817 TaxID=3231756 RepID=UPI00345882BB
MDANRRRWLQGLAATAAVGISHPFNPSAMAEEPQPADSNAARRIVAEAIVAWGELQSRYRSAQYEVTGKGTVHRHGLQDLDGNLIPVTDYHFRHQVKYAIDLTRPRIRREATRDLFNLSDRRFETETLHDLFDGKEYQQYYPVRHAFDGKTANARYWQPRLVLRGGKRSQLIVRAIDIPLFWNHGLLPIGSLKHTNLSMAPAADAFQYVGAGPEQMGDLHIVRLPSQRMTWEYWLSPDHAFLPIRRSAFYEGTETSRLTVQYKRQPDVTPLAESWTLTTFGVGRNGKQAISTVDRCRLASARFDDDLADVTFSMAPGPGIDVDDIRND